MVMMKTALRHSSPFLVQICVSLLLMGALMANVCSSDSGVYKYQDKTGRTHYVNDPLKIPEEYRKGEVQPHVLPTIVRDNKKETPAQRPFTLRHEDIEAIMNTERDVDLLPAAQEAEKGSEMSLLEAMRQVPDEAGGRFIIPALLIAVVLALLNIVSLWILLERGGHPGIGVIVPIYNMVLMSRLAGKSGWWVLWCLIPAIGGIIWGATVNYCIAKNFGRSDLFAVGAVIFPFIFFPIIAFGPDAS